MDNLSSGNLRNLGRNSRLNGISVVKGDVCDRELVKKTLRDIEAIFHEAAVVSVQRSIEEPEFTYHVNVDGTLNLLNCAVDSTVDRFVLASSAAVYGNPREVPVSESVVPSPISPYGESKLLAEKYAHEYHQRFGLGTTALRYFNVYGPGSASGDYSAVIAKFAQRVASGERMIIYGDGRQNRDFVYIDDVVTANVLAATSEKARGETFNVGSGKCASISEVAQLANRLFVGSKPVRSVDHQPAKAGDIDRSWADISKIGESLEFTPRFGLEEGLTRFWEWFISRGAHS